MKTNNKMIFIMFSLTILFTVSGCGYKPAPTISSSSPVKSLKDIEGVWQRYQGPNQIFEYMIIQNGKKTPFICSYGEKYLNKRVRVSIRYINGGPSFDILKIALLDNGGESGTTAVASTTSRRVEPSDSREAIQLVSAIKSEFSAKRDEMADLYNGIEQQKAYIEEKKLDLPWLDEYARREEIKRIESVQHAAVREISHIRDWISSVELVWDSRISSVQWASNSPRKGTLISDIGGLMTELHNQYDNKLRFLDNYFKNLEIPR